LVERANLDLAQALEKALGMLGPSAKHALQYHLQRMNGTNSISELTFSQIKNALLEIFGSGASVIIDRLCVYLYDVPEMNASTNHDKKILQS
jgi:hypothetical protein